MDRPAVLVVDDESINRTVIGSLLEERYEVGQAGDGLEALAELARRSDQARPYDLVLMDVQMPRLDGFETCRRIKAATATSFLPVLMLTSLAEQRHRLAGLEAGADDFLTKPVDPSELTLRVAAFVRLRQQDRFLRLAIDRLSHLHAMKDDLFSLVVHDIRNPFYNLQNYLELIRKSADPLTPDQAGLFAGCDRNAAEVLRLLDGVLDVTRLEEGALTLAREEVDLARVAAEAAAAFAGTASLKKVQLDVAAPPTPSVRGDARLLRRCVDNLLSNALRHTPRESRVEIAAGHLQERAWIQVTDGGPGVPAELRETVFQKFFTEGPTQRRGYGLGLHLVKLAASAHRGSVELLDNPDGGAIFRLSVPIGR